MKVSNQGKDIAPLLRRTWNTRELLKMYRPHHAHPNKALLFDLAFDEGPASTGEMTLSRWPALPLPATIGQPAATFGIEAIPGLTYAPRCCNAYHHPSN